MTMYITWNELFLFGTFLLGLIRFVLELANHKKK